MENISAIYGTCNDSICLVFNVNTIHVVMDKLCSTFEWSHLNNIKLFLNMRLLT